MDSESHQNIKRSRTNKGNLIATNYRIGPPVWFLCRRMNSKSARVNFGCTHTRQPEEGEIYKLPTREGKVRVHYDLMKRRSTFEESQPNNNLTKFKHVVSYILTVAKIMLQVENVWGIIYILKINRIYREKILRNFFKILRPQMHRSRRNSDFISQ